MFLKNRNISSKIKRSKVTDYAALTVCIIKLRSDLLLRIDLQIFGLHWRMQNIGFLMSLRSPLGFKKHNVLYRPVQHRHKKPNILHHPVPAKNLNFNSCIYYFILSVKYAI